MTNHHPFTISAEDATKTLIEGQHGSFYKGIVELVMNEVDGNASKCEITINKDSFVVKGDGCGFGEGDTAVSRFKELGSRHSEREGATFGRFGLGRTQVLPWGKIKWSSGYNRFSTDHQNYQGFHLESLTEPVPGCLVEGELYADRQLASYELSRALSEITEHLQFVSGIEITLNGAVINNRKMEWDIETEQIRVKWLNLNTSRYSFRHDVKIHNQGVLVMTLGHYQFQAIVVTKKAIKVNMARNSPDKACPVWQEIEDILNDKQREVRKQNSRRGMTKELREGVFTLTNIGLDAKDTSDLLQTELDVTLNRLIKEPFLSDVRGRFHVIQDIRKPVTLIPHGREREAEQLSILGTVIPITISELNFWKATDVESLSEKLIEFDSRLVRILCELDSDYTRLLHHSESTQIKLIPFEEAVKQIDTRNILLPNKELTPVQAAARNALQYAANNMAKRLSRVQGVEVPRRAIRIGKSYSSAGWTDAATFIAVERNQLKYLEQGVSGATYMALLLLHEYMHNEDFPESDTHGELFYESFHESALTPGQREIVGNTASGLMNRYLSELLKKNLSVPNPLKDNSYFSEVEEFTLDCGAKGLSDFALWLINTIGISIIGGRKNVTLRITRDKLYQGEKRLRNALHTHLPRKLSIATFDEREDSISRFDSLNEITANLDNIWHEMAPEIASKSAAEWGWDANAFSSFLARHRKVGRHQNSTGFMGTVMDAIINDADSKAAGYSAPTRPYLPGYKVGNANFSAEISYWEYRGIAPSMTRHGLRISGENLLSDSRVRMGWVAKGVHELLESIRDDQERDEIKSYLRDKVLGASQDD